MTATAQSTMFLTIRHGLGTDWPIHRSHTRDRAEKWIGEHSEASEFRVIEVSANCTCRWDNGRCLDHENGYPA